MHQVEQLQESGVYRDESIVSEAPDNDLEPDQNLTTYDENKVRLTKYYGLVPRWLFDDATTSEDEELVILDEQKDESKYIEAIVVIANGGTLLKIEQNPYMLQDRPVVGFAWDAVPGRFWGRGICEKGYNSQKALDTELRARIDALALTVHPMLAVDASRLPRGTKMEVRPGKTILTNGNPAEILQPFRFGNLDPNTFNQAASLQQMVQMATGAIDAAGIPGSINGDATAAGISMSLGAIIKRHKRTLINFQESFIIPLVTKAAHRYMQFEPETYPVADYKFDVTNSLVIIDREYEVTQLVQLLQTMSQDAPMYLQLVKTIYENITSILASSTDTNITGANKGLKTQNDTFNEARDEAEANIDNILSSFQVKNVDDSKIMEIEYRTPQLCLDPCGKKHGPTLSQDATIEVVTEDIVSSTINILKERVTNNQMDVTNTVSDVSMACIMQILCCMVCCLVCAGVAYYAMEVGLEVGKEYAQLQSGGKARRGFKKKISYLLFLYTLF